MPMSSEEPSVAYQTYLLRLRPRTAAASAPGGNDQQSIMEWHFTLVHPYTGARRTFDSLEALMAFLREQIDH